MPIKITIYEDDSTFREGLEQLITIHKEFKLTGSFPDCKQVIEQTSSLNPDIILMDIDLPDINGIQATLLIKDKFPEKRIIILSALGDEDIIFDALQAGVKGYLYKGDDSTNIINSIELVHAGKGEITPTIAGILLEHYGLKIYKKERKKLTERQFRILRLMYDGLSYKMVAAELGIQMGTVQVHIKNIYDRLEVHSKSEAFRKVFR